MSNCLCIFCAGIAAVCSGTSSRGVCSCGFCCKHIEVSFGWTEQDMLDDQDRVADYLSSQLEKEIWMAEADWLSIVDFISLLANRPSVVAAFG